MARTFSLQNSSGLLSRPRGNPKHAPPTAIADCRESVGIPPGPHYGGNHLYADDFGKRGAYCHISYNIHRTLYPKMGKCGTSVTSQRWNLGIRSPRLYRVLTLAPLVQASSPSAVGPAVRPAARRWLPKPFRATIRTLMARGGNIDMDRLCLPSSIFRRRSSMPAVGALLLAQANRATNPSARVSSNSEVNPG